MYSLSRRIIPLLLAIGVVVVSPATVYPQSATSAVSAEEVPVTITATDYAFRAPSTIASGWTNFRFKNEGEEPHFVFLSRLPEGKTIDDYERDLSLAFNEAWHAIRDGEVNQAEAMQMLGENLPDWFPTLQFVGGPGFASPDHVSETTLFLEPGNYVLECYMKTEEGEFHYMEGMMRPLTVSADRSAGMEPEADIQITLSNSGMDMEGALTPGQHVFAVHAKENPEQGFGHSAHLARLDDDTKVEEVVEWMNAFGVDGLRAPAPADFIGGVHMMPTGSTTYFTADLTPGRYLLISEATAPQGMYREFTVESEKGTK